jgi:hypothetical protein
MGLFDAIRRWWTQEGLPRCFLCKAGIRRRDIDRGKALVLGRQPYCRKCVKLFTTKPAGEGGGALADSSSHAAKA